MAEHGQTRQEILHYIKYKGEATTEALCGALEMTPSAMRQHLGMLVSEGMLETHRERSGPGRPKLRYVLTNESESAFEKRYEKVTLDLLEAIVEEDGYEKLTDLLNRRRKKILARYYKEVTEDTLEARLQYLVKVQSQQAYMADLEVEGETFLLCEHNCPFIEVSRKYQQFCEAERRAFEEFLGESVELKGCQAQGDRRCVFCVKT